jgi:hypothetical protein
MLAVPFYDSFIFNNQMRLAQCIPNILTLDPVFFIEENNLPFDKLVSQSINKYIADHKLGEAVRVQSIFYKNRADCEAFQTYKILNHRKFGKQSTLSSPNLDHFGSDEFCWEAYQNKLKLEQ